MTPHQETDCLQEAALIDLGLAISRLHRALDCRGHNAARVFVHLAGINLCAAARHSPEHREAIWALADRTDRALGGWGHPGDTEVNAIIDDTAAIEAAIREGRECRG